MGYYFILAVDDCSGCPTTRSLVEGTVVGAALGAAAGYGLQRLFGLADDRAARVRVITQPGVRGAVTAGLRYRF